MDGIDGAREGIGGVYSIVGGQHSIKLASLLHHRLTIHIFLISSTVSNLKYFSYQYCVLSDHASHILLIYWFLVFFPLFNIIL